MKMKIILVAFLFPVIMQAQVKGVTIQASGLTCSMCSNAIFKALKTVDFVDQVDANIKTSSFEITVKPGTTIDFDKLKGKVEDAGFFVAGFTVNYNFDDVAIDEITAGELTQYPVIRYGTPDGFTIDLIARIGDAFRFEDIRFRTVAIAGHRINIADEQSLISMKENTMREVDTLDVRFLREKLKRRT